MKKASISLNDSPLSTHLQDEFHFKQRIVSNILNFLERDIKPCIIGITAPWGAGKTSVCNLLKQDIEGSYKFIDFDPIIESKFEVSELIESFILKISMLVGHKKSKEALKSIALMLAPHEIALGIPKIGLGIKWKNFDKKIDTLLNEYKKNKFFSDCIKELDQELIEKNLIVFIDEIDRLPAEGIIKFLLFVRILESFKNIRCIITFDYENVLEKLTNYFGDTSNQGKAIAMNYLEKFFLVRYEVCSSLRTVNLYNYTKKLLKENEVWAIIENRVNFSKSISIENDLTEIASLLETPRNCKRWIIEVTKIKGILLNSEYAMDWLRMIAIFTKAPIILSHFARVKRERNRLLIKDDHFTTAFSELKLPTSLGSLPNKFDKNIRSYHIGLFLDGIENARECSMTNEFMKENINELLIQFIQHDLPYQNDAIDDIANMFYRDADLQPLVKPDLDLLLQLWDKYKVNSNESLSIIVQRLLLHRGLDQKEVAKIVSSQHLFLGEKHLINLLKQYGIVNNEAIYCFDAPNINITDEQKEKLKNYLRIWLSHALNTLFTKNTEKEDKKALLTLSACYRYIQWSQAAAKNDQPKNTAQKELISLAKKFFKNQNHSKFKDNFIRLLGLGFSFENADHLKKLFQRDKELVSLIKKYADTHNVSIENYSLVFPAELELTNT